MSLVVGLTGEMGSGKSTVLEMLRLMYSPRPVRLVKFAEPLYNIQEYIYNRILSIYKRPETFIKDRKLLQWIGTEWGRETISDALWVDLWKAKANEWTEHNKSTIVVSDDCRFDNEAETIKSLGGFVVKVFSSKNKERIDTEAGIVHHKSESGVSHKFIDYWIDNNGSMEHLRAQVSNLVAELNERAK